LLDKFYGYAILLTVKYIDLVGVHEMNEEQLFLRTEKIDFANFSGPNEVSVNQRIEDELFESSGLSNLGKENAKPSVEVKRKGKILK
jgi:hypothetical protein